MFELGIDDAGRGPLIGPMILAGCLIDKDTEKEFKRLGVKDSKQLTKKRREFLVEKIREKAETFEIVIINPDEIDGKNKEGINLNHLEALACAEIINRINKGFSNIKIIIDCPSPSITKWKDFLRTKIENLSNIEISCEHKADKNHVSVSAASILAKSVREKEIENLKKIYGDGIGSGYCSDPLTKKFLADNIRKHRNSNLFRKSWGTFKNANKNSKQKKLEF